MRETGNEKVKTDRQKAIIKLIEDEKVSTQIELTKRLEELGFAVTQATVSRDIRELKIIKTTDDNGGYHYKIGKTSEIHETMNKFHSIFRASVYKVDYANNLVVVKCYTGMAQAVCATMDSQEWEGVVGTVSGDDTILIVMRDEKRAAEMVQMLEEIM